MGDKRISAESEKWTGDLSPLPPKEASTFGLLLALAISLVGVVWSPLAIVSGFQDGRIRIPLLKGHHWVSIKDIDWFILCLVGWILLLLLMCGIGIAAVRLLVRKAKTKAQRRSN